MVSSSLTWHNSSFIAGWVYMLRADSCSRHASDYKYSFSIHFWGHFIRGKACSEWAGRFFCQVISLERVCVTLVERRKEKRCHIIRKSNRAECETKVKAHGEWECRKVVKLSSPVNTLKLAFLLHHSPGMGLQVASPRKNMLTWKSQSTRSNNDHNITNQRFSNAMLVLN